MLLGPCRLLVEPSLGGGGLGVDGAWLGSDGQVWARALWAKNPERQ